MDQAIQEYWRRNVRLKAILLVIWALVSVGFGILLRRDDPSAVPG